MPDMDTATLEAHIAVIKHATEASRESCEGDWRGKDFAQEQSAYDPSEVDHAIAAILNAVADGVLVPASALTAERAGADALAAAATLTLGVNRNSYFGPNALQNRLAALRGAHRKLKAALSAHDARRKGGV